MASTSADDVVTLTGEMERFFSDCDKFAGRAVKLTAIEHDLLKKFEDARIQMFDVVKTGDRSHLDDLFGGSCKQTARIRFFLENSKFSLEQNREDKRKQECLDQVDAVDAILADLGRGAQLEAARASLKIDMKRKRMVGHLEAANTVLAEMGEDVALQPMDMAMVLAAEERTALQYSHLPEPASLPPLSEPKADPLPLLVEATPEPPQLAREISLKLPPRNPEQQRVATEIATGRVKVVVEQVYTALGGHQTGGLDWNSGKIRTFIMQVFAGMSLPPPEEGKLYSLYSRFDDDGSWTLDMRECGAMIECMLLSLMGLEEADYRQRISQLVTSGQLATCAHHIFAECDRDGNKALAWNNGELRNFIERVFLKLKMTPPTEQFMFAMFTRFDVDQDQQLDRDECEALVETLCMSLQHVQGSDEAHICPSGHVLTLVTTPVDGFSCNTCHGVFPMKSCLWECKSCNYWHLCVQCLKQRRASSG